MKAYLVSMCTIGAPIVATLYWTFQPKYFIKFSVDF